MKLECQQLLTGHGDRVWSIDWNPEGTLLASCGGDKTVKIWGKGGNDKWVRKFNIDDTHTRTVRAVKFSPCGQFLATASFDGTTNIYKIESADYELITSIEGHESEVKSVSWDKTGMLLSTCGRDKTVWIWQREEDFDFECLAVLNGHSQDVKSVLWGNGEILFSSSYDDSIKIWKQEMDDWYCVKTLMGHNSTVWTIDIDSDGAYLASGSADNTVKIWERVDDESDFKVVTTLHDHEREVFGVAWESTQELLATCGADDKICIYKREKASDDPNSIVMTNLVNMDNAHSADVNCVRWHPSGTMLASCGDDDLVKVWTLVDN